MPFSRKFFCEVDTVWSCSAHRSGNPTAGVRRAGRSLFVRLLTNKPVQQVTIIRIAGRISDSSFPFKRVTVRLITPAHNSLFSHFRLTPPRLVEDTREGVMFEHASQTIKFSSGKLAAMEFHKRLVADHLWIRIVQKDYSVVRQIEALSVALTALFTFMGVCSLAFTLTLRKDQALDLTRPFRFHSSDFALGVWTALLVTPLITIIVEILNRCERRLAATSLSERNKSQ